MAARKKKKSGPLKKSVKRLHLIASDSASPAISVKPGMKLHVVSVKIVDAQLKQAGAIAATLCGGTSTCVAMFES